MSLEVILPTLGPGERTSFEPISTEEGGSARLSSTFPSRPRGSYRRAGSLISDSTVAGVLTSDPAVAHRCRQFTS